MANLIRKIAGFISIFFTLLIVISGSVYYLHQKEEDHTVITEELTPLAGQIYDSQDQAIFLYKNTEEKTVQFQNLQTGKRYTLSYNGATTLKDKNDQPLSIFQFSSGDIVSIRFYKDTKELQSIEICKESTKLSQVNNFQISIKDSSFTYLGNLYRFDSHLTILSQEKEIDLMDIHEKDILNVWIYQDQIYSIQVVKGHGYLKFENDSYFIDGWIDIGQKVIQKITEDMIVTVPEGTYTATVSNKGNSATQTIEFKRDEELVWDLGNVEIKLPQKGSIIFTISPENAKVTIDGSLVNISEPVELTYGLHQLLVMADQYETVSKYIKVGAPNANIALSLDPLKTTKAEVTTQEPSTEASKDDTTASSTSTNTILDSWDSTTYEDFINKLQSSVSTEASKDAASSTYKVYIDAPENVEAYLDGNYIGITPLSFKKEAGNYIITLRKDGFQTRSYSLQVDDEQKDVNYSFSALLEK